MYECMQMYAQTPQAWFGRGRGLALSFTYPSQLMGKARGELNSEPGMYSPGLLPAQLLLGRMEVVAFFVRKIIPCKLEV